MARILLVEDENSLRRILTITLARRGHSVAEADSAESAEEALAVTSEPFDLILLDVNLPDATGWDVLRWITPPVPPVIVLSAVRPQQSRLDKFHPAGVLLKPFPIPALLALIDRVVSHTLPQVGADENAPETVPDPQG